MTVGRKHRRKLTQVESPFVDHTHWAFHLLAISISDISMGMVKHRRDQRGGPTGVLASMPLCSRDEHRRGRGRDVVEPHRK